MYGCLTSVVRFLYGELPHEKLINAGTFSALLCFVVGIYWLLRSLKDAYDNITPDRIESLADNLLHALEEQGGSVDGFVSFLEGFVGQDEADATRA